MKVSKGGKGLFFNFHLSFLIFHLVSHYSLSLFEVRKQLGTPMKMRNEKRLTHGTKLETLLSNQPASRPEWHRNREELRCFQT